VRTIGGIVVSSASPAHGNVNLVPFLRIEMSRSCGSALCGRNAQMVGNGKFRSSMITVHSVCMTASTCFVSLGPHFFLLSSDHQQVLRSYVNRFLPHLQSLQRSKFVSWDCQVERLIISIGSRTSTMNGYDKLEPENGSLVRSKLDLLGSSRMTGSTNESIR